MRSFILQVSHWSLDTEWFGFRERPFSNILAPPLLHLPPIYGFIDNQRILSGIISPSNLATCDIRYIFHVFLNCTSQEAEEKSNEIRAKAKEEADIEKQKLVMTDKKKIQSEYDRKQKQVIMQQRMWVLHSLYLWPFIFMCLSLHFFSLSCLLYLQCFIFSFIQHRLIRAFLKTF